MSLSLHTIKAAKGSGQTKKRVGRGLASKGRYSGRGVKGQRSRSGGKSGLKLKGLRQVMLATPKKRGFKSNKPNAAVVNLKNLSTAFASGAQVTPKALLKKGLISKTDNGVKILAQGEITIALTISGCTASAAAKEKIEKAGGSFRQ